MRLITVLRAVAWFGVAVTWWSLNVLWGNDPDTGTGPPNQFVRPVVGAGLLATIAAMALSISGRGTQPPSWVARGIALAGAASTLAIAWYLRSDAKGSGFDHLLEGPGWTWLLAGGGFVASAAVAAAALRAPAPKGKMARKAAMRQKKRKKR